MASRNAAASEQLAYTDPAEIVHDFASRGIVILAPEHLGVAPDLHSRVFAREQQMYLADSNIAPADVPELLELLQSPGLVSACDQLAGKDWAIVPFTHNAPFASGSRDQHWHKDDNSHRNGRKQRHHQAVQIEMLYFPQAVRPDMGPTATIPYSHYWAFNHEENHDNFAGADHLDFDYQILGLERQAVSGPDSTYAHDDIAHARTAHDVRMREVIANTGWPLVRQFEAAPLRAGSVLLYSHNTFHRGNHRRDDSHSWRDNPRFMWRFWIYRTTDPHLGEAPHRASWAGVDPLTGVDLTEASEDATVVWRYQQHWMHTGEAPPPRAAAAALSAQEREAEGVRLSKQLLAMHDGAEPARIGAAYQLASIGDTALALRLLGEALRVERESVRRAATYGLVAVGAPATNIFIEAAASPVKWLRKAGVYGLGDASPLTSAVFEVVAGRLRDDPSVYVRSVAAGSLGCLGRRAVASGTGVALLPACAEALLHSVASEENRLAMDLAQNRSIKFTRPTDECDVCEGGAFPATNERFRPVRSAVRENALWSLVMLCSHDAALLGAALEPLIAALTTLIGTDENAICVGYAMDALTRVGGIAQVASGAATPPPAVLRLQAELPRVLSGSPLWPWESLVRSGLSTDLLRPTH
jgi:hypothetical protein